MVYDGRFGEDAALALIDDLLLIAVRLPALILDGADDGLKVRLEFCVEFFYIVTAVLMLGVSVISQARVVHGSRFCGIFNCVHYKVLKRVTGSRRGLWF